MKTRPTLAQAKAQYPHRYTYQHIPAWAKTPHKHTSGPREGQTLYYAPQFLTDADWYANTKFEGEDELANKGACFTHGQAWPVGQWLTEPFSLHLVNRL